MNHFPHSPHPGLIEYSNDNLSKNFLPYLLLGSFAFNILRSPGDTSKLKISQKYKRDTPFCDWTCLKGFSVHLPFPFLGKIVGLQQFSIFSWDCTSLPKASIGQTSLPGVVTQHSAFLECWGWLPLLLLEWKYKEMSMSKKSSLTKFVSMCYEGFGFNVWC